MERKKIVESSVIDFIFSSGKLDKFLLLDKDYQDAIIETVMEGASCNSIEIDRDMIEPYLVDTLDVESLVTLITMYPELLEEKYVINSNVEKALEIMKKRDLYCSLKDENQYQEAIKFWDNPKLDEYNFIDLYNQYNEIDNISTVYPDYLFYLMRINRMPEELFAQYFHYILILLGSEENTINYRKKLELVRNCIYGINERTEALYYFNQLNQITNKAKINALSIADSIDKLSVQYPDSKKSMQMAVYELGRDLVSDAPELLDIGLEKQNLPEVIFAENFFDYLNDLNKIKDSQEKEKYLNILKNYVLSLNGETETEKTYYSKEIDRKVR